MLNSANDHYYSSNVCYFLVYNLQNMISNDLPELQAFLL